MYLQNKFINRIINTLDKQTLNNQTKQTNELLMLDRNTWNHFTEYKQMNSDSCKNNCDQQCIHL